MWKTLHNPTPIDHDPDARFQQREAKLFQAASSHSACCTSHVIIYLFVGYSPRVCWFVLAQLERCRVRKENQICSRKSFYQEVNFPLFPLFSFSAVFIFESLCFQVVLQPWRTPPEKQALLRVLLRRRPSASCLRGAHRCLFSRKTAQSRAFTQ